MFNQYTLSNNDCYKIIVIERGEGGRKLHHIVRVRFWGSVRGGADEWGDGSRSWGLHRDGGWTRGVECRVYGDLSGHRGLWWHVMASERVGGRVGSHRGEVPVWIHLWGRGNRRGRNKVRGSLRRCYGDGSFLWSFPHRYFVNSSDLGPDSYEWRSLCGRPSTGSRHFLLHDVISRIKVLLSSLTGDLTSQKVLVGEPRVREFGFEFCFSLGSASLGGYLWFRNELSLGHHWVLYV